MGCRLPIGFMFKKVLGATEESRGVSLARGVPQEWRRGGLRVEVGSRFVGLNRTLGLTNIIRSNIRTGCTVGSNLMLIGNRIRGHHNHGVRPKSAVSCSKGSVCIVK